MIKDVVALSLLEYAQIKANFPSISIPIIQKFTKGFNPFSHLLLYYHDEEILGILWYDFVYERMEICQFQVQEKVQNQHIGSKLLEELIQIAMQKEIENITLEVRESNKKAIYLYQKLGFKIVFKRKCYDLNED